MKEPVSRAVIPYPISQLLGWSPSATLLPLSPHHAICCYGRASKLSTCYLHTGTPPALFADGRVPGLSVCMLMSSIRISLVVVFAEYGRHSLSYDIVAMCGWRLISQYWLIDIIPSIKPADITARTLRNPGVNADMTLPADRRLHHIAAAIQCAGQ